MKINNVSFPHPVLGISDDISGAINVNSTIHYNRDKTLISVSWTLDCLSLNKLITNKQASFCVEIDCADTIFREIHTSFESTQEILINTSDIRNMVHLNFYIVASKDIPDYSIKEFNSDYLGYTFSIQKGDALAIGGKSSFPAEKSWEALKSVSSFMDIGSYPEETGPVLYNFDKQKIKILLSEEDFGNYGRVWKTDNLSAIFHSSLVLPALIRALIILLSNPETDQDKKWFQVLKIRVNNNEFKEKLKTKTIDLENIMEIAQAILDNPVHRTLEGINLFLQRENRNDDY